MQNTTGSKNKKRLLSIISYAASNLLLPALNFLLAWLVIHWSDRNLWGAFVEYLIFAQLAVHLMSWGNQEWLLRAFSKNPGDMGRLWRKVLVSRGILIFIAVPSVLLSGFESSTMSPLLLWIAAGFMHQSFQVWVVYYRRFFLSIAAELAAFAILFMGLWINRDNINPEIILKFFALGMAFKALTLGLAFRKQAFQGQFGSITFKYFQVALPFFLLGFSGMLQSRVDLYCVAWILEDKTLTGTYQVMIGFFIYLQAVAGFVLTPFVKNLYRLPDASLSRMAWKLLAFGVVVTAAGVPLVAWALHLLYGIELPLRFLLWGAFTVLPIYFYLPYNYLLFKNQGQQKVLLANVGGILLNIALNLSLIGSLELEGALIATAAAQVFTLLLVVWYARNSQQSVSTKEI